MPDQQQESDRPFLIEHLRLDETNTAFVPSARLHITPHARKGGFLRALNGNQAKLLLALMTHLTPNGNVYASAAQLAQSLGIPTSVAALWLMKFRRVRHLGEPIIYSIEREYGPNMYTLSHKHVRHAMQPPKGDPPIIYRAASREAIIAHTHANYTAHVKDVEQEVLKQLGHHVEELMDNPEGQVWQELRQLTMKRDDIQSLIETFGAKRILQQLEWLPERNAKNRVKVLVTALVNDYGPPKRLRDVLANSKFDKYRNSRETYDNVEASGNTDSTESTDSNTS